jgi:hypothetical protein
MSLLPPRPLWLPLASLVVALVLGALSYGVTRHLRHEAAAERARAELEWRAASADLARMPARIELVKGAATLHADLQRRGFLGPERRLEWLSALARVHAGMALDSLAWRLGPRAPDPRLPGLGWSSLEIRAAPLDAAGLRTFLTRLADESPGLFTVRRCTLLGDHGGGQAECVLDWWTLAHARPAP